MFEALLGHMIGGSEEKIKVSKLIHAVSGTKFVTWPSHIHREASAGLIATYGGWRLTRYEQ
jgi:hypothetical protein